MDAKTFTSIDVDFAVLDIFAKKPDLFDNYKESKLAQEYYNKMLEQKEGDYFYDYWKKNYITYTSYSIWNSANDGNDRNFADQAQRRFLKKFGL